MGRRRPDRHRYGPKGEYLGRTSDESPLTRLVSQVLGTIVIVTVLLLVVWGCA